MANINSSTRFGVVYGTPAQFAAQASTLVADPSNYGKLYVLTGETSGAITQGVYIIEPNSNDPDGYGTISMLSSGTYASLTNAGLLDPSLYDFITKIKNGSLDVPNANHANTAGTADVAQRVDSSLYIKVKGQNFKTYDADESITFDISAGDNIALSTSDNTLTISATDTTYSASDGVVLSGTVFSHADTNTNISVDTSYGQSMDASQTAKSTLSFNVPQITLDKFGHVKDISVKTIKVLDTDTDVDKNWETDPSTGKVYLTGKSSNAANNVSQGYVNSSVYMQAGKVYATTGDIDSSGTALVTGKAVADYVSTQLGNLSGALIYKDNITAYTQLPTPATTNTGHVYICSSAFTTTAAQTGVAYNIEVGDMFISNGSKWNIVSSEFDVSANANGTELSVGGTKTIATVDGVDIKVSLPAKGDNVYYEHPAAINGSVAVSSSDGGDFTFSTSAKTLQVITGAHRDSSGHISKLIYKDVTLPAEAYSDTIYTHPVSISGTILADSSLKSTTATPVSYEGTFTVATGVYRDASGHISKVATETFKLPAQYVHPVAGDPAKSFGTVAAGTTVTGGTLTKIATVHDASFDASGHFVGTIARDISINVTDGRVKASTSDNTIYLIGQDDTTNNTTEQAYKNASVYMKSGKLYSNKLEVANIGTTSDASTASTVYGAKKYADAVAATAKTEAIAASVIYWETL